MVKKVLIGLFVLLFFPTRAFAVSVSINNPPTSISSDDFTLNVTVSGANAGNNYLRIDLYKDGTSNYFGDTYNGSDWYSGSDGTKYFLINITSGSDWTGDVKARVGSPNLSEYDGQGSYKIRIRRYTDSGNQGGEDANASAVPISINVPTITPTPSNTPTPTQQPTNTPTPGPSDTPVPTPTPAPLKKVTPTPIAKVSQDPKLTPQVLAAQDPQVPQQGAAQGDSGVNLGSKLGDLEPQNDKGYNWWKLFMIMGAAIITGAVGVFLYNNHIKERTEELNQNI